MAASPIRVGLIGLGQTNVEQIAGGWGANSHLPYLLSSPKYEVVAICNSSIQSAKSAIAFHKLSQNVKAYGSSEDLAKDPDIDLIVVSVKVAKHYELTKPALLAGKDVFVEWPLGKTTAEAEELLKLAEAKGVRTIVGEQARANPMIGKVKELVNGGHIGNVISSTVVGSFAPIPYDCFLEGAEYYLDKDSGGTPFTINFGHFLQNFIDVLGSFDTLSSVMKTDFPTTKILNTRGEVVNPNHPRTSADHIAVLGTLSSGAAASLTLRTLTSRSLDGVGIRWLITGSDGELEITSEEVQWQCSPAAKTVLRARLGRGAEVQVVEYAAEGEAEAVRERSDTAVNTALLYEAYASEGPEGGRYQDFRAAVELHRLLDRIEGANQRK